MKIKSMGKLQYFSYVFENIVNNNMYSLINSAYIPCETLDKHYNVEVNILNLLLPWTVNSPLFPYLFICINQLVQTAIEKSLMYSVGIRILVLESWCPKCPCALVTSILG